MATKQSKTTKTKKQPTSPKKNSKKTNSVVAVKATKKSLTEKISALRSQRRERKAEIKRHKQTDKARLEKAKQRAVREKALEQVNEAVAKSKRRKSRPMLTLFFALALAGLGALAMYQYSQLDIEDRNDEITQLESEIADFADEKKAIEDARLAEAEKFTVTAIGDSASLRAPREWIKKASQYPTQEQLIGDDNVTLTVVNSASRDSIDTFIPIVDYLWVMDESANGEIQIASQSLHCNRFDTFNNDLTDPRREHQGFTVYCDDNAEEITVAVLRSPEAYGLEATGDYFMVTIKDIQQTSFDNLKAYIESYTTN